MGEKEKTRTPTNIATQKEEGTFRRS